MKRVGGYIIAIIGLIGILLSFEPVKKIITIPGLELLTKTQMLITGLVIVIIGVIIIGMSGKGQVKEEVPIYKGEKIIGYRRH